MAIANCFHHDKILYLYACKRPDAGWVRRRNESKVHFFCQFFSSLLFHHCTGKYTYAYLKLKLETFFYFLKSVLCSLVTSVALLWGRWSLYFGENGDHMRNNIMPGHTTIFSAHTHISVTYLWLPLRHRVCSLLLFSCTYYDKKMYCQHFIRIFPTVLV